MTPDDPALRKVWRYPRFISEHAFDKLRLIDCTFGEFESALTGAEVIETVAVAPGEMKEVLSRRRVEAAVACCHPG